MWQKSAGGELIYEPVLLAQLQNGEILLEMHRDPYRKKSDAPLQFVLGRSAARISPNVSIGATPPR
jgi:hypothetical protein